MSFQNFEEGKSFQLSWDYYSEIFTSIELDHDKVVPNKRAGTKRENCYLQQMKLEENCPIITNFPTIQPPKIKLSPTERWITFPEDETIIFARDTFKLKAHPGRDRPRRKFQSNSLNEFNINKYDLLSKKLLEMFNISAPGFCEYENFLPLEIFDDRDYRTRLPENWIEFSFVHGRKYPLPAEAFLPNHNNSDDIVDNKYNLCNRVDWLNVAVDDYDFDKGLWKIITLDGYKRLFYLPEIYVIFKADNLEIFAKRIKNAIRCRYETEIELKYSFHLDNMILDGIQQPSLKLLDDIYKLATKNTQLKYDESFYNNLEEEFKLQYQSLHCDLQVRNNIKNNQDLLKYFKLPEPNWTTGKIFGNYRNIETGIANFSEKCQYFQWMNIYVLPQIYQLMFTIVCECFKIEVMSLFNTEHLEELPTLDEFEDSQRQCVDNIMEFLQGSWLLGIVSHIQTYLAEVDKGWFNLRQDNYETYQISKLLRLIELTKFRMQQSLRNFVMNTVDTFINFIEPQCLKCFNLTADYQWRNNLIDSPFISKYPPIFKLDLINCDNFVEYSTDPDLFQTVLLDLYNNSLIRTHQIPQIQLYLMESLRFSNDLFLTSVGLLDDKVSMIRERIIVAYQKAIIPLKAYLETFNVYIQSFIIDIDQYFLKFNENEIIGSRIQQEILSHRQIIDKIKSTIPDNIIIGPFLVIIKDFKGSLISIREQIVDKLFVIFTQFLKNSIEILIDEYKWLILKLNEKPEDVETVFTMLDWIDGIPLEIELKEELTRKYLNEYSILDGFFYNLSDDDFNTRWEIICWPFRIAQQIQETVHYLEDEELERFYKIQQDDEAMLNEKIDQFQLQVSEVFRLYESNKLSECTIDMRSLLDEMNEAERFAQLLNRRQELFKVTVVPFETLIKLIEEFTPIVMEFDSDHKDFLNASDFDLASDNNSQLID